MTLPEVCKDCGKLAFPGETVTISAVEYEELRRFKEARTEVHAKLADYRLAGHSGISRDPELARFILSCAETMTTAQVRDACVERFGTERVPHRTTIHRFIHGSSPLSDRRYSQRDR